MVWFGSFVLLQQQLKNPFNVIGEQTRESAATLQRIKETDSSLKRLDIYYEEYNQDSLNSIFETLQNKTYVEELLLTDIPLDNLNAINLFNALKQNHFKKIQLNGCGLDDTLCKQLAEALIVSNTADRHAPNMAVFEQQLAFNSNKIGPNGAKFITDILYSENNRITTLCLNTNNVGNEGIKFIADAIMKSGCCKLTSLNLGGNKIRDAGAIAIANALKDVHRHYQHSAESLYFPTLTRLSLDRNYIGSEGCIFLGEALAQNKSLMSLSLWSMSISCIRHN